MEEKMLEDLEKFIMNVDDIERQQDSIIRSKSTLEASIVKIMKENKENKEALDICQHAIEILRKVSDAAVTDAYEFLQDSINATLERMFRNTTRKIKIKEYIRSGRYPQLELELLVGNGKTRKLKSDSGHGLAQIVSILSILSVIVITGARRLMILDEVLSGLSMNNLKIIDEILWTFTEIGFQFMITEHGFVPKGAKVYHMEMVADVAGVKETYIEPNGVYLNANTNKEKESEEEYEESQENYYTDIAKEDRVLSI